MNSEQAQTNSPTNNPTITFKVTTNPLETLGSMQVAICEFLIELETFYRTRDSSANGEVTAEMYSIASLIHATVGLSFSSDTPEMLTKLASYCQHLGNEQLTEEEE